MVNLIAYNQKTINLFLSPQELTDYNPRWQPELTERVITTDIVLYTTGCAKCEVLKKKLDTKGVSYNVNTSVKEMLAKGIAQAPMLEVNGEMMDFAAANEWINQQ